MAPHNSLVKIEHNDESQERPHALASFTGRAMHNLLHAWQEVKSTARTAVGGKTIDPSLPPEDVAYFSKLIAASLEPKGGEVTARANTVELGRHYLRLNSKGRKVFFKLLATGYDIDHEEVQRKATTLAKIAEGEDRHRAEHNLRKALIAPRTTLFRQFNSLPDGFKFLVDMRSEILSAARDDADLSAVERDLKYVLSAWFDVGLLDLEEITWRSPAELLEKLMVYEAVHAIRSWDDLKNRLDADRRVYAFFHNKMALEPLIFVQVAFTKGLADNIQDVLDETKPTQNVKETDTAIFYSISNAQQGLAGISFGNFLIKRVVGKLTHEFKNIKTYATLSPVPGFCKWLNNQLEMGQDDVLFMPFEIRDITAASGEKNACDGLRKLLADAQWHKDEATVDLLHPILMRLAARYLIREKRGIRALDPVAHFHLSNGAQLEQINWLGDISEKGLKQSAGIMVNYHYKLSDIDDNHEDYVTDGRIAASKSVHQWARG
ncbi:MAG: malonyl-CoA decarboxylase [Alphaproteobacteria bacterium]|nr:malonyl-CoA decarboxylase [Alphaproteobacteria bacterium]